MRGRTALQNAMGVGVPVEAPRTRVLGEPTMETACSWYPQMPNQYLPVAWKDSLFEFLLLWNGDISIPTKMPLKHDVESFHPFDAQLEFYWSVGGLDQCPGDKSADNSAVTRTLLDGHAPVVLLGHRYFGVQIDQEVFAHYPGSLAGGESDTAPEELSRGDELYYLWNTFTAGPMARGLAPEERITLRIRITANRLAVGMEAGRNSFNREPAPEYALPYHLSPPAEADGGAVASGAPVLCLHEEGSARLAIWGDDVEVELEEAWHFTPWNPEAAMPNMLRLSVPADGRPFGLVIPVVGAPPDQLRSEVLRGRELCRERTRAFWQAQAEPGTRVRLPEKLVQDGFRAGYWHIGMIAERNPTHNVSVVNTGSFNYDCLWPTPNAMTVSWGLDLQGHHRDAERYLEVFRASQGQSTPPGDTFAAVPGFLSAPDGMSSIRWTNEHGAVMWAVSEHFLLTGNHQFWRQWRPAMMAACEWVAAQRAHDAHPGAAGLMPPGVASDDKIPAQFVWNDGWVYRGLYSCAQAMAAAGDDAAQRWFAECDAYRFRFQEVFLAAWEAMPVVEDDSGGRFHLPPTDAQGLQPNNMRQAFYLDTGPLFLAFAGLLEPDHPLFTELLRWFREGPHRTTWRFDGCCWQLPVLHHEMSSCEPCYSWNIDVSLLRRDRGAFVEGLYALLAGSRTTDLFSDVETRNGMFATNLDTPVAFRHLRNSLVWEAPDALELLRLVPASLLAVGADTQFGRLPTYYGACNLQLSSHDTHIVLKTARPERRTPEMTRVYAPPGVRQDQTEIWDAGAWRTLGPPNDGSWTIPEPGWGEELCVRFVRDADAWSKEA